jgi:DnaJ-class molecular chaperone
MSKDFYAILGVARNAGSDEIRKAYRKLAMQYHPDKNPGKEQWANEKFKEINEAYAALGDPEKRKRYDSFGTYGNAGDIFGSQYTRTGFEDVMKDFKGAGLNYDFLYNIFGDLMKNGNVHFKVYNMGFGGGGIKLDDLFRQMYGAMRQDVEHKMSITKKEAAEGTEKDISRKGKKLRVKIPAGIKTGTIVRLRNAMKITDGVNGDILVKVKVK